MTREPDDAARVGRRRSRRKFLQLVAAGSVAALAAKASGGPLVAAATTSSRKVKGPGPAVRAEIKNQKDALDRALKVIREYELPAGSEMSLDFMPLEPAAASGASRSK